VPAPADGGLNFAAASYLKRVRQGARSQLERQMAEELQHLAGAALVNLPPTQHHHFLMQLQVKINLKP
jgi:hypothetical protein